MPFPIVGVGASAGGLDAFKKFLSAVPDNSGMAYVFVQHLNPDHESALPEILARFTKMQVQEITQDLKLMRDNVYVIPENRMLTVTDGILKLIDRNRETERTKIIDLFFSSLGSVHQGYAIGVVLSGVLNDGSLGLRVIKNNGGITFAQDPATAAFPDMPENAIKAGIVDFVLPADQIPIKLLEINHPFNIDGKTASADSASEDEKIYKSIIILLRSKIGTDFTYYKEPTIKRRIARRMALMQVQHSADYLHLLKENRNELETLYGDLLISVTSFFRDPSVFEAIQQNIIPTLISQRPANQPLRLWIVGCATGEEAYSYAIALFEAMGSRQSAFKLQIFATDISEKAIAKARIGTYKKAELDNVSPQRLSQFFTKLDGAYQINKSIREICVFAQHNFLKDPPFSKIDMISCRNVLIYLEPVMQKKAFVTFNYALNEKSVLVLGKTESIGQYTDLFKTSGLNEKIYYRTGAPGRFMHVASVSSEERLNKEDKPDQFDIKSPDIFKRADDVILSKYSQAGVLVNEHYDIVQFRGTTDPWLAPSPGKASLNVLKMAREGLGFEIRNLLHLAKQNRGPADKAAIRLKYNDQHNFVNISVYPMLEGPEPHFLILFKNQEYHGNAGGTNDSPGNGPTDSQDLRVEQLESELLQSREDMRNITEEQEAANEELQSANEELLSGSEELQAVNEELETSKEELQSTNEELIIVNHELVDRNDQLSNARKYSDSIVKTIRDPLVILDRQLIVKKITTGFEQKFDIKETDAEGKSFFQISGGRWDTPELHELLDKIFAERKFFSDFPVTLEYPYQGKMFLLLNARMDQLNGEEFIMLAMEDITDNKKVEESLNALKKLNISLEFSNRELEQFAYVASHDLQEPLRKIMTFSHIIEEREMDIPKETNVYVQKITDAAKRMDKLIKDLLNFSRLNAQTRDLKPIHLEKIIQEVLGDLELKITETKATFSIGTLPVVEGVPHQLYQLFYNLISNSLKFSRPEVVPQITITALPVDDSVVSGYRQLDPASEYYDISVSDNSIGFREEYAEKIFTIFTRLHQVGHFHGSGIGLALCKKIVINHEGEIFARSEENVGSTFHVILPTTQKVR